MRFIASANNGATVAIFTFGFLATSGRCSIESVTMTASIEELVIFSRASAENKPCVTATLILFAPSSL